MDLKSTRKTLLVELGLLAATLRASRSWLSYLKASSRVTDQLQLPRNRKFYKSTSLPLRQIAYSKTLESLSSRIAVPRREDHQTTSSALEQTRIRAPPLLHPRNLIMNAALRLQAKCQRSRARRRNLASVLRFRNRSSLRAPITLLHLWLHLPDRELE